MSTKLPEEKILMRSAFRWLLNGQVCRWCYEHFSMEYVLEFHQLKLIHKIDEDTAFVTGDVQ